MTQARTADVKAGAGDQSSPALVEQLGLFCQRWHKRRATYRPAGEVFDPRYASVQPLDTARAKAYIEANHYSASMPAARFCAGLFLKEPFHVERLVGVGVFSVPMNERVVPAYFDGFDPLQGIELGRFTLDQAVPANAESWTLPRMQRLLRQALPDVRGVLAYCDPVERRDESGEVVKRGHIGTIYKATNALYRGTSSPRTLWLAPNGAGLADRMLSKIRRGETGERYALEKLAALGAPRRQPFEAGDGYIGRLKAQGWLRPVKHPGNLAFTWAL